MFHSSKSNERENAAEAFQNWHSPSVNISQPRRRNKRAVDLALYTKTHPNRHWTRRFWTSSDIQCCKITENYLHSRSSPQLNNSTMHSTIDWQISHVLYKIVLKTASLGVALMKVIYLDHFKSGIQSFRSHCKISDKSKANLRPKTY